MIMAAKNSANKSVNVNVVFNVTFGVKAYKVGKEWVTYSEKPDANLTPIPANAAVLVNERKMRINGEMCEVEEFMAIEGVKSTKMTDLVMPVLAVMLADVRIRGGFASDFKVVTVAGKQYDTMLTAKSAYTKWLKGNVLYKSNAKGELNKALVVDEGLRLRNTALRVTEKQPLYSAKDEVQKALMHKTAEAIVKQATLFTDIQGQAKSIFDATYATPATKKSEEKSEKAA